MNILYNSQLAEFKKPFGAVKRGEIVEFNIKMDFMCDVFLRIIDFNENNIDIKMELKNKTNENFIFNCKLDTKNLYGAIKYYFEINYNNEKLFYGNNSEILGGMGQEYNCNPKMYQLTVYDDYKIPNWYKEGIIYQIFVDRFYNGNDNNEIINPKKNSFIYGNWNDKPMYIKDETGKILRWDFYGGNLKGVIKKLGYLKDLGISIIYFNPIFESSSCHKYNTGDYEKIDAMFGDEEIFKDLCVKAENLGIKIILDGVFSHTGADSKYFNKFGNYNEIGAYQSKKSKYYSWYMFNQYPNDYECWWDVKDLPDVYEMNDSYLKYIVIDENSIIKKWMKLGAKGWRLDVADELPDEFIECLKQNMKKQDNESVLIGEVWEDASNKISYNKKRKYLYGHELDSIMNYPIKDSIINFINRKIDAFKFVKLIMNQYENYPKESFYANMNLLGSHDTKRILTVFDCDKNKLKLAIVFQIMIPGVPCIYYGDEVGLCGLTDPDNRRTYPWGNEDYDILNFYKKIISIRNQNDSVKKGEFEIKAVDKDVVFIERTFNDEQMIIIVNASCKSKTINDRIFENCNYINMINGNIEVYENNGVNFEKYKIIKRGCQL